MPHPARFRFLCFVCGVLWCTRLRRDDNFDANMTFECWEPRPMHCSRSCASKHASKPASWRRSAARWAARYAARSAQANMQANPQANMCHESPGLWDDSQSFCFSGTSRLLPGAQLYACKTIVNCLFSPGNWSGKTSNFRPETLKQNQQQYCFTVFTVLTCLYRGNAVCALLVRVHENLTTTERAERSNKLAAWLSDIVFLNLAPSCESNVSWTMFRNIIIRCRLNIKWIQKASLLKI